MEVWNKIIFIWRMEWRETTLPSDYAAWTLHGKRYTRYVRKFDTYIYFTASVIANGIIQTTDFLRSVETCYGVDAELSWRLYNSVVKCSLNNYIYIPSFVGINLGITVNVNIFLVTTLLCSSLTTFRPHKHTRIY